VGEGREEEGRTCEGGRERRRLVRGKGGRRKEKEEK